MNISLNIFSNRSRLRDWPPYLLARAGGALLSSLPWNQSRFIADKLARFFVSLQKEDRYERAVRNVQEAFPHFSQERAEEVVNGAYRTVFRAVVDGLQFRRRLKDGQWRDLIDFRGQKLLDGLEEDRGVIFASGHFGSWELMGLAIGRLGFPVTTVVRPIRNPLLDNYVKALRQSGEQQVVERYSALRRSLRELRRGGNMGFLMDQDARTDGVFVDFMGRPASTQPSVARLSIRTNAPVAFIYARELEPCSRFVVEISDVIWPRQDVDRDKEVFRITQRITDNLEKLVREYPEQWMWTENRWKTYPGKHTGDDRPKPGMLRWEDRDDNTV